MNAPNPWLDLTAAIDTFTASDRDDLAVKRALQDAVLAYAKTRSAPSSPPTGAPTGAVFPPYGKSKGMPVAGASRNDLEFYRNGCLRTLGDESKSRWHDKERALLAAIDQELAK